METADTDEVGPAPLPELGLQRRCIELSSSPDAPAGRRRVAMAVARILDLPLADADPLLERLPVILPRRLAADRAERALDALRQAGAAAKTLQPEALTTARCSTHPTLDADGRCVRCRATTCTLCSALGHGKSLCGSCQRKLRRSKIFYRVRVALLLALLGCVLLWAWRDVSGRRARTSWAEPLSVGLVVVRRAPVDAESIALLRQRVRALQQRLAAERRRYAPDAPEPFHFIVYGPVDEVGRPPALRGEGWLDQARTSYDLWRYLSPIDEAAGLAARGLDSRVYLVVRPPTDLPRRTVEGMGEEGGRIGIVEVELDETMVDYALFVAAHELFHTLGATDKYDASGRALVPDGLAEPGRTPLYPQRYAELMARLVPLGPTTERPPESLAELRIGTRTAREIGWVTGAP